MHLSIKISARSLALLNHSPKEMIKSGRAESVFVAMTQETAASWQNNSHGDQIETSNLTEHDFFLTKTYINF